MVQTDEYDLRNAYWYETRQIQSVAIRTIRDVLVIQETKHHRASLLLILALVPGLFMLFAVWGVVHMFLVSGPEEKNFVALVGSIAIAIVIYAFALFALRLLMIPGMIRVEIDRSAEEVRISRARLGFRTSRRIASTRTHQIDIAARPYRLLVPPAESTMDQFGKMALGAYVGNFAAGELCRDDRLIPVGAPMTAQILVLTGHNYPICLFSTTNELTMKKICDAIRTHMPGLLDATEGL